MKNLFRPVCTLALLTVTLAVTGCTHRDTPPSTPVENTATPTYRSTVNSYEMNTAPRYTQSGIDGGEPATLPSIPSPSRFSQNTPLANAVYNSIPQPDNKYIIVASKGGTIKLSGTVKIGDLKRVLVAVHTQPGVRNINITQLQIK